MRIYCAILCLIVLSCAPSQKFVVADSSASFFKKAMMYVNYEKAEKPIPRNVILALTDSLVIVGNAPPIYDWGIPAYKDTTAIQYDAIIKMTYELSMEPNERAGLAYGLNPVLGMFAMTQKVKKHWFNILFKGKGDSPEARLLILDDKEQRQFRFDIERRSGKSIEVNLE